MLCLQENPGAAVVAYPVFGLPDLLSSIKSPKFISIIVVRTGVHVIRGFKPIIQSRRTNIVDGFHEYSWPYMPVKLDFVLSE